MSASKKQPSTIHNVPLGPPTRQQGFLPALGALCQNSEFDAQRALWFQCSIVSGRTKAEKLERGFGGTGMQYASSIPTALL